MEAAKYTVASTSPSAIWIEPQSFRSRIDATYYSVQHMRLDDIASNINDGAFRPLGSLLTKPRRILYMKTDTFDGQSEGNKRIPFISGIDIDGNTASINWATVKFVDAWMAERYPNGILQPNSLLIKVKGPHQLATFVERPPCTALVSGTCVICGVCDVDSHYLVAYLTSSYAEKWRTRLRQNITVEFTPYEELAAIPVIYPNPGLQVAIGSEIRKADRLRALGRTNWIAASQRLEKLLGISLSPKTFNNFSSDDVSNATYKCRSLSPAIAIAETASELGAQYFHPRRIHARQVASKAARCSPLREVAQRISRGNGMSGGFIGLDVIDSETGLIDFHSASAEAAETGCASFEENDVLFSRLRPYLNKVSIWPCAKAPGRGSGELLVYRATEIDSHYLFFVLKSQLGLNQVIDVTAGSTHPRADAEVVDEVFIPRLDENAELEIGALVRAAHMFWYEAHDLLPRAKADVEALIDGTLDEKRLLDQGEEIIAWLAAHPLPESERNTA